MKKRWENKKVKNVENVDKIKKRKKTFYIYGLVDTQQEAEAASLNRRVRLVDEDLDQTSARLEITAGKLQEASKLAEKTER